MIFSYPVDPPRHSSGNIVIPNRSHRNDMELQPVGAVFNRDYGPQRQCNDIASTTRSHRNHMHLQTVGAVFNCDYGPQLRQSGIWHFEFESCEATVPSLSKTTIELTTKLCEYKFHKELRDEHYTSFCRKGNYHEIISKFAPLDRRRIKRFVNQWLRG